MSMLEDGAVRKLRGFFKNHREILLAYLFGSQARGDSHAQSDIDLAILCDRSPSIEQHSRLIGEIGRLLGTDGVDLIILNDAPPLLKFDAISEGKLLYQGVDDDSLNEFEHGVIREYFDTESMRSVQDRYLKERLLGIPSGF